MIRRDNTFEKLKDKGIDQMRNRLAKGGFNEAAQDEAERFVREFDMPGMIGFLATNPMGRQLIGQEFVERIAIEIADQDDIMAIGIGTDDIESALWALWRDRRNPTDILDDPEFRRRVHIAGLKAAAARSGLAVSDKETEQALRLLTTGQFFTDMAGATATIARIVPGIPIPLIRDSRKLLDVLGLGRALASDLGTDARQVARIGRDLLEDGKLDGPAPVLLNSTLAFLYSNAGLKSTVDMLHELTGNESVQLAIIVYARSQGFPVDAADIEALRDGPLNTRKPNFGPLLQGAWSKSAGKFKKVGQKSLLRRLRNLAG